MGFGTYFTSQHCISEREQSRLYEERLRREQEQIDRLLAETEALEQAEIIRSYVNAVRLANAQLDQPAPDEKVNAWAVMALAQADEIDPVLRSACRGMSWVSLFLQFFCSSAKKGIGKMYPIPFR